MTNSPTPLDGAAPTPDVLAARRVGEAGRRLLRSVIASRAPAATLDEVAATLDGVAEQLEPYAVQSRYEGTAGLSVATGGGIRDPRVLEHHLLLGEANPLAPPLVVDRSSEGHVRALANYDLRYEGMPGWVHGGAISLAFDLVLGLAAGAIAHRPVMTGTFILRYRKPSYLWTDLVYEADAEADGPRKINAHGTLRNSDGEVCVEAEGIWIRARTDNIPPAAGDVE